MRTVIDRLPMPEALKKYSPDTKFVTILEGMGGGHYYNGDTKDHDHDATIDTAWSKTLAWPDLQHWGSHCIAIIFTELPSDPNAPPVKKCRIEQAMRNTIIELLKAAPGNPIARAHALNDLKRALPDDCKTFEQIKEWVEFNCNPAGHAPPPPLDGRRLGNPRPTPTRYAFYISASASERQHGTCKYECTASGSEDINLTVEEVMEAVDHQIENDGTIEDAVSKLCEGIEESACNDIILDGEDYDYDEYELDGSDDYSVDFNSRTVRTRLCEWLASNHPDKLHELEENE